MNIRQRIVLLVILAFVAISTIGIYAVTQARGSATKVKTVTEGVVPSALASADLVSQLKDVQIAAMVMVLAPNQDMASEAADGLTAKKTLLKSSLEFQLAHTDSDAQKGLVDEARESMGNYFDSIDETMKLKLSGKSEMAKGSFFGNVVQYQLELEKIVETLRVEKNRSKDKAIGELNDEMATTAKAISLMAVFAVLFLATVGSLLYRAITAPISRMQVTMTEIATNQDFTRRIAVERKDEIGRSIIAFNGMIEKIQESSAQLKQKTADIQTMLQNIPQGILTIVPGNTIHHEYSAYLETLFETRDIVGRNVFDLVFSDTSLGTDALSQTEAVVGACIGEDAINFEFNVHLLVGEIEKTMPDGRIKILDLSWSPITDEADIIVRLMLCVRDVTELRQLAAEANEQKRELETIGEILSVSQEKFHEFISSARKFLDENETAVRQHREYNEFTIALLFRNMHTIKGNARTYGLAQLSDVVHDAEQHYDALRKTDGAAQWEQQTLLSELAGVRAEVERYAKINEMTLGRKGPGRRAGERYLMIDKKLVHDSLQRLENVNTANLHELISVRDQIRRTLSLLGTESLAQMLAGVTGSLPTLAQELGKAAPIVSIEDNGYRVHSHAGNLLKNVFMHLIRNAMDHGIETPDLRMVSGKSAAGTIALDMNVADGVLRLSLRDDGRGLALDRIRQKAIDKGLQGARLAISDDEIAALVFRPGFSTADTVTNVSGRGVGLDAVKDFITREQGRIEIRFLDDKQGEAFRQFEIVVNLPEQFAVFAESSDPHHADHEFAPLEDQYLPEAETILEQSDPYAA